MWREGYLFMRLSPRVRLIPVRLLGHARCPIYLMLTLCVVLFSVELMAVSRGAVSRGRVMKIR